MVIRCATVDMIDEIERVYADAREFMKSSGNPDQWSDGYPQRDVITSDIEGENLFVCVGEENEILAVFYYRFGIDPTYERIYEGEWSNGLPYGVVHRIAVCEAGRGKGIVGKCFDFAYNSCQNLKIDTHRDNIPMQKALLKRGFEYCGIIHLENGEERFAYQKGRK